MTIVICVMMAFLCISAYIFYTEAKHAPLVDEKEPFLHDDYDPSRAMLLKARLEDDMFHFAETFCTNCKFYDGTAMCLHEENFGELADNLIKHCKKESMFEAK